MCWCGMAAVCADRNAGRTSRIDRTITTIARLATTEMRVRWLTVKLLGSRRGDTAELRAGDKYTTEPWVLRRRSALEVRIAGARGVPLFDPSEQPLQNLLPLRCEAA